MTDESNVVAFPKEAKPTLQAEPRDLTCRKRICGHSRCVIRELEPILECKDCGAFIDPYEWMRKNVRHIGATIKGGAEKQRDELLREAEELSKLVRQLRGDFKSEIEKRRFQSQVVIKPPKRAKLVEG